ncbi:MAG: hypothetical protein LC099_03750 [Anaerolineales bacterium]|nr:hypothetical protein [Anaerolineales bacterium]
MNAVELEIQRELDAALNARANQNEGRARVCARRAAGVAIREYLSRKEIPLPSRSAHTLLIFIQSAAPLPPELKTCAAHLTIRVTEEFKLPIDADLVAEARALCDWLMKN